MSVADGAPMTFGRRARRLFRRFLILGTLLGAGCHHDPDPTLIAKIVAALGISEAIETQRLRAGRAFGHFVRRRVLYLVGQNASWGGEANFASITQRVKSEMDSVIAFLDVKVGTPAAPGPLGGPTENDATPHVDLADVAKVYVDDTDTIVASRREQFVQTRLKVIDAIIWRACALHHELWDGSDSATSASVNQIALTEILDRRLRAVERMLYTDSSIEDRPTLEWTIESAQSWKDQVRVTLFEYPFLNNLAADGSDPFSQALAAKGLSLSSIPGWSQMDPTQLRYNVRAGRINPQAQVDWKIDATNSYIWDSVSAADKPSVILDKLMPNQSPVDPSFQDFWNRNWVFCDHMISALHLDALRFALLRRNRDNDNEFNSAAASGMHLTVLLSGTSPVNPTELMGANASKYFDAVKVSPADLEVGDHIIFWNNYLFRTLLASDFGLENSLLSDAAGDLNASSYVGHGEKNRTLADFAERMLEPLATLFTTIRAAIVNGGGLHVIDMPSLKLKILPWAPYGEHFSAADANQMQVAGAWWIRVKLADTARGNTPALNISDGLNLFPNSVAIDLSKGMQPPTVNLPDHTADWRESIYLPLSVPNGVQGGWPEYFSERQGGEYPGMKVPLDDVKIDASWAPGLLYKGVNSKVPVLRPKVRRP